MEKIRLFLGRISQKYVTVFRRELCCGAGIVQYRNGNRLQHILKKISRDF